MDRNALTCLYLNARSIVNKIDIFQATVGMLEDASLLFGAATAFRPDVIVRLAAQAGGRESLEDPRA